MIDIKVYYLSLTSLGYRPDLFISDKYLIYF